MFWGYSEGVIKFVQPELRMHKPPLQDDINFEAMLNRLRSAISQQTVVIGIYAIQNSYIEENSIALSRHFHGNYEFRSGGIGYTKFYVIWLLLMFAIFENKKWDKM